jgi:DNA-binding response OmpR family regulator
MKILVAEDDPISRRLMDTILRKWGYETVTVVNGREAWEALQSEDAPRLAILDWMMPEMDGTEVCAKIRERTNSPYVYIVLLSAKSKREDVVDGFNSGVDDYMTKPFDAKRTDLYGFVRMTSEFISSAEIDAMNVAARPSASIAGPESPIVPSTPRFQS